MINDYKSAKKAKENLKSNIEIIENQIFESENDFAKSRLKNAIGQYQLNNSFDDTKKLVHSLIEKLTIKHTKEEKGGFFVINIKYKGFDELSVFMTNWQLMKWYWMYYYRNGAMSLEQLQEDIQVQRDLFEFRGIKYDERDFNNFVGAEIVTSMHEIILLNKDFLLKFD